MFALLMKLVNGIKQRQFGHCLDICTSNTHHVKEACARPFVKQKKETE
jgi:hypothetical protein